MRRRMSKYDRQRDKDDVQQHKDDEDTIFEKKIYDLTLIRVLCKVKV